MGRSFDDEYAAALRDITGLATLDKAEQITVYFDFNCHNDVRYDASLIRGQAHATRATHVFVHLPHIYIGVRAHDEVDDLVTAADAVQLNDT